MPGFSAERGAFTPATSNDNWTLFADTAGDVGEVMAFGWGGRLTTSTGYRTRWCRPSTAGVGAATALANEAYTPGYATPLCIVASTFATTQPALPADPDNLFAIDWNAHGGVGYIVLPLDGRWKVINGVLQGQISCRNVAGVDANGSSYSVSWME